MTISPEPSKKSAIDKCVLALPVILSCAAYALSLEAGKDVAFLNALKASLSGMAFAGMYFLSPMLSQKLLMRIINKQQ